MFSPARLLPHFLLGLAYVLFSIRSALICVLPYFASSSNIPEVADSFSSPAQPLLLPKHCITGLAEPPFRPNYTTAFITTQTLPMKMAHSCPTSTISITPPCVGFVTSTCFVPQCIYLPRVTVTVPAPGCGDSYCPPIAPTKTLMGTCTTTCHETCATSCSTVTSSSSNT